MEVYPLQGFVKNGHETLVPQSWRRAAVAFALGALFALPLAGAAGGASVPVPSALNVSSGSLTTDAERLALLVDVPVEAIVLRRPCGRGSELGEVCVGVTVLPQRHIILDRRGEVTRIESNTPGLRAPATYLVHDRAISTPGRPMDATVRARVAAILEDVRWQGVGVVYERSRDLDLSSRYSRTFPNTAWLGRAS